jgi:hypothetical protein
MLAATLELLAALRALLVSLRSSSEYQEFAAISQPQTLVRGSYTYCRKILPVADGTLVVRQRNGDQRTLTLKTSVAQDIEATEIISSTGIVQVLW